MSKIWKPHSYQKTAISFLLSNPHSGLFLDPGLGKTSISLTTIKILKYSKQIKGVLIIAPLRVAYSVWPGEINKWSNFKNLNYIILHANTKSALWGHKKDLDTLIPVFHEKDTKASLWNEQKDLYIINPEGLKWLHGELLTGLKAGKKCPFNCLWIDESTKFKSYNSARFGYIKDMLSLFKRKHIMTGTPAPKSMLDLWSQMYILDEGKTLGKNYYAFRKKYFQANDWNKYNWEIKDFSAKKIHNLIAPMVLEMSANDYLDMPELLFNNIYVKLPVIAMSHYKKMEKEFFMELDGFEVSAEATVQASMKCHQIANGNVYEDIPEGLTEDEIRKFLPNRKVIHVHKVKIEALQNLIDELNGKPLLIAYHYKHDLKAIKESLGNVVPYIGSGISPSQTKAIEAAWNAGKLPILLGHPASMAHGLNLQECGNDVCFFSLTWNLELYDQFFHRIYRQGVKGNKVRVHHLIAKNTLDEAMMLRLSERANQQYDLRTALKKYRKNLCQS